MKYMVYLLPLSELKNFDTISSFKQQSVWGGGNSQTTHFQIPEIAENVQEKLILLV